MHDYLHDWDRKWAERHEEDFKYKPPQVSPTLNIGWHKLNFNKMHDEENSSKTSFEPFRCKSFDARDRENWKETFTQAST